jgi:membrane-associated phospholipid phosphatase
VWEWAVPVAAIGVGTAFAKVDKLAQARRWVQKGMATNRRYHTSVDNYLQYVPIVESYALQLAGYKGEHNLVDRTVVLAMSYVTFAALNLGLKHTIGEKRPDSEATNSFPSGHSGTVMVGAECLRREYWNRNRWVALSGYAMVLTTNYLRIHNNRHWINDVIAGDALGFLSTTFAYWLYPKLFRNHNNKHQENMLRLNDTYQTTKAPLAGSGWIASPVVNSSNCGIACSLTF